MSNQVEEAAKPVIVPMIAGRTSELSPSMQRTLATWAAKTVMTGEHINKDKAVIQQFQRTWLKDYLEPPQGWIIWANPYSGSEWRELGLFQHGGRLELPSVDDGAPIQHCLGLTFIGMGHLLLQVFHTSLAGYWDDIPARDVTRIWPPTGENIQWPSPFVFTDFETRYFSTFMSRILDPRGQPATD